jgi:hypothetical protein
MNSDLIFLYNAGLEGYRLEVLSREGPIYVIQITNPDQDSHPNADHYYPTLCVLNPNDS